MHIMGTIDQQGGIINQINSWYLFVYHKLQKKLSQAICPNLNEITLKRVC